MTYEESSMGDTWAGMGACRLCSWSLPLGLRLAVAGDPAPDGQDMIYIVHFTVLVSGALIVRCFHFDQPFTFFTGWLCGAISLTYVAIRAEQHSGGA